MRMKFVRRPIAGLLALLIGATSAVPFSSASAIGLMEAFEAALKNDPAYRAAYYAGEAGKENRILGRAGLLPSVSGNYSGTRNNTGIVNNNKEQPPSRYISRSATVQVRQSVFNLDALANYKKGVAQSNYAAAQLDSQSQEVILRVVAAYVEVLFKEDQVALAKVERDVYVEQRNVNELLFKKGEGTRTDTLETQSRLDLAEASLLEAQDALATAMDTLAGIIGGHVDSVNPLRPGFRVAEKDTLGYDAWKNIAVNNNPDIRTMTYGVEVAKQEINKQRAGHAPRLDVVGTYGKTGSESITLINQDQTIRSIGFQLSVPFYNGGAVNSATRQAVANREKAAADLETQVDKVLVELRRNYNQVASSVSRIDALIKAVDSAKLLITATEQSIKGGVRINLDLLTAQRQLYTAQRDLAQARYGYMLAALRLRGAAGTLSAEDVRLLAAHFE